jgi:hypothetical protein
MLNQDQPLDAISASLNKESLRVFVVLKVLSENCDLTGGQWIRIYNATVMRYLGQKTIELHHYSVRNMH